MGNEDIRRGLPEVQPVHEVDRYLDRPIDVRRQGSEINTLIPYTNPMALIGYYFGVFSLVPVFAILLGPAALVLGILGLRFVQNNPAAKGTVHAWVAIGLGSITFLANIGLLMFILVMIFMTKR
jgi:hypothetical protein